MVTLLICKYCLIDTKNQKVHLEKFDTSERSSLRNLSPRKSGHFENEWFRKSDQFEIDHLSQIEKGHLENFFIENGSVGKMIHFEIDHFENHISSQIYAGTYNPKWCIFQSDTFSLKFISRSDSFWKWSIFR